MKTRACTHCGNQVAMTSKLCPYCRKNPVSFIVRTYYRIIVWGFVGFLILAIVGSVMKKM